MITLGTYNKRDGTSQHKRFVPALDTNLLKIVEEDPAYWLAYIKNLAPLILFFNENNQIAGDWAPFFPKTEEEIRFILETASQTQDLEPHLALLLAFLEMLTVVQKDMNGLVQKHLDFYYQKVLKIRPKGPEPDKAYVAFELAKNAKESQRLVAGTKLFGGKDNLGKNLVYQTTRELIVNRAKIASLKTVFVDENDGRVYSAEMANSADGRGAPLPKEAPYWSTFGESQWGKPTNGRTMQDAEIGFAIASPTFLLKEGLRTITVELTLKSFRLNQANIEQLKQGLVPAPSNSFWDKLIFLKDIQFENELNLNTELKKVLTEDEFNQYAEDIIKETNFPFRQVSNTVLENAFKFSLSKEDGWLSISGTATIIDAGTRQQIRIETDNLTEDIPAVVSFPAGHKLAIFPTSYPIFRIIFDHNAPKYPYPVLKELVLTGLKITVSANGVKNLILFNDLGVINPTVPFFPFGTSPVSGTKFYVGSSEIFQKKIDFLTINLSWGNLPADIQGFIGHYSHAGYNQGGVIRNKNDAFKAKLEFLSEGKWLPELGNEVKLFTYKPSEGGVPGKLEKDITRSSVASEFKTYSSNLIKDFLDFQSYHLGLRNGFMRMELLSPDFGHAVYPDIYTEAVIAFSKLGGTFNQPNKPYTPKLTAISLDYASTFETDFSNNGAAVQLFQIGPFGFRELNNVNDDPLVPNYKMGNLFLGLQDIEPNQKLSILVQQLEGSGDAGRDLSNIDMEWNYLSEDKWRPIADFEILADSTAKMNTTGIVEFKIKQDINSDNHWLPEGYFWLKASSDMDLSGINKSISFQTQAVEVAFANQGISLSHFEKPLEKGHITRMADRLFTIKAVEQPMPSFGGKGQEKTLAFSQRVSERLRHKQRASTVWDYERIVLNEFPDIFKLKCIKHVDPAGDYVPGAVTLLVVPDLKNRQLSNPFEPKVSPARREQIKKRITDYTSVFTNIFVDIPQFEPLRVEATIAFKTGFDAGFYANQLNEALKKFLSPWAYEEGEEIEFGGRIYLSRILAFIESLYYVDFVADFSLFHLNKGPGIGQMAIEDSFEVTWGTNGQKISFVDTQPGIGEMIVGESFVVAEEGVGALGIGYAEASLIRSILVSAPDHKISISQGKACNSGNIIDGIGAMYVEVNFVIS